MLVCSQDLLACSQELNVYYFNVERRAQPRPAKKRRVLKINNTETQAENSVRDNFPNWEKHLTHEKLHEGKTLDDAVWASEELEEAARLALMLRGLPGLRALTPMQVDDLLATFG